MSELQLAPLRCASCRGPLAPAGPADVLYCAACPAAFQLGEDGALGPVPLSIGRLGEGEEAEAWLPFWTFEARAQLLERDPDRGSEPAGLFALFAEPGSRRVYVCAGAVEAARAQGLSQRLTREQPVLPAAPAPPRIEGLELSQRDARLLAEDLFVSAEVGGRDTLQRLRFQLTLEDPRLAVIAV